MNKKLIGALSILGVIVVIGFLEYFKEKREKESEKITQDCMMQVKDVFDNIDFGR